MERFCTNCGNVLEEGALFCPECGERVAAPAEEKAPDSFIAKLTKTPAGETATRTLVTKDEEGKPSKEVAELYRS